MAMAEQVIHRCPSALQRHRTTRLPQRRTTLSCTDRAGQGCEGVVHRCHRALRESDILLAIKRTISDTRSLAVAVTVASALSAAPLLHPLQTLAVTTSEIPGAGTEAVAGTEAALQAGREEVNRQNQKRSDQQVRLPCQRCARCTAKQAPAVRAVTHLVSGSPATVWLSDRSSWR